MYMSNHEQIAQRRSVVTHLGPPADFPRFLQFFCWTRGHQADYHVNSALELSMRK